LRELGLLRELERALEPEPRPELGGEAAGERALGLGVPGRREPRRRARTYLLDEGAVRPGKQGDVDVVPHVDRRRDPGDLAARPRAHEVGGEAGLLERAEGVGDHELAQPHAFAVRVERERRRGQALREPVRVERPKRVLAGALAGLEHGASEDEAAPPAREGAQDVRGAARVRGERRRDVEVRAAVVGRLRRVVAEDVERLARDELEEGVVPERDPEARLRAFPDERDALRSEPLVGVSVSPQRRDHLVAPLGEVPDEPRSGEGARAGEEDPHGPPALPPRWNPSSKSGWARSLSETTAGSAGHPIAKRGSSQRTPRS